MIISKFKFYHLGRNQFNENVTSTDEGDLNTDAKRTYKSGEVEELKCALRSLESAQVEIERVALTLKHLIQKHDGS